MWTQTAPIGRLSPDLQRTKAWNQLAFREIVATQLASLRNVQGIEKACRRWIQQYQDYPGLANALKTWRARNSDIWSWLVNDLTAQEVRLHEDMAKKNLYIEGWKYIE